MSTQCLERYWAQNIKMGTQLICVEFNHDPVDYDLTICTLL